MFTLSTRLGPPQPDACSRLPFLRRLHHPPRYVNVNQTLKLAKSICIPVCCLVCGLNLLAAQDFHLAPAEIEQAVASQGAPAPSCAHVTKASDKFTIPVTAFKKVDLLTVVGLQ